YGGDPALYKALHPYLSAAAAIKYMARVEGALALALADLGITDKSIANAIASAADRITAQEVADEETRTRHDVRALVNVIRNQVPDEAKRFVHLGATSYDIVDTANALRYRECTDRVVAPTIAVLIAKCISIAEAEADTAQIGRTHGRHAERSEEHTSELQSPYDHLFPTRRTSVLQVPDEAKRFVHHGATNYDIVDTANALRYRECTDRVVAPTIAVLIAKCISIAEAEADTAQIGRTHGRHAEPVTFGFAMAEYVSRLGDRLEQLRLVARRLPGK